MSTLSSHLGNGNGPPRGVEPSELFAKLLAVPRPTKMIDHPRKDPVTGETVGRLQLVPLTESEMMQARAAAEGYSRMMLDKEKNATPGDSLGYRDLYVNALYVEVLFRATRTEQDARLPIFLTSKSMRDVLFPDEIAVLFEAYMYWQAETGPIVSNMTEKEMEQWLDMLGEGASRVPLSQLSSQMRNDLLLFGAVRLRNYSTGKSSPGSPVDEAALEAGSVPEPERDGHSPSSP